MADDAVAACQLVAYIGDVEDFLSKGVIGLAALNGRQECPLDIQVAGVVGMSVVPSKDPCAPSWADIERRLQCIVPRQFGDPHPKSLITTDPESSPTFMIEFDASSSSSDQDGRVSVLVPCAFRIRLGHVSRSYAIFLVTLGGLSAYPLCRCHVEVQESHGLSQRAEKRLRQITAEYGARLNRARRPQFRFHPLLEELARGLGDPCETPRLEDDDDESRDQRTHVVGDSPTTEVSPESIVYPSHSRCSSPRFGPRIPQVISETEERSLDAMVHFPSPEGSLRTHSPTSSSRYHRDFEEVKVLGVGAFGTVMLCRLRATKDRTETYFAIKRIPFKYADRESRSDLALQREASSLAVLQHPHIVRYQSAWVEFGPDPSNVKRKQAILNIQMEHCAGSTLRNAIDAGAFERQPAMIWVFFRQILDALTCMHNHGLIHRDLKPSNIFLQSPQGVPLDLFNLAEAYIKIGDFGLATFARLTRSQAGHGARRHSDHDAKSRDLSGGVGTRFYMSPEQERGGHYGSKSDMYSLGVILFEMWHPAFVTKMERICTLSRLKSLEFPPDFVKQVPPAVPTLLKQLLSEDPEDRPSASALQQSLLIPLAPSEEFQSVFEFLLKNPNCREAKLITQALLHKQLQYPAPPQPHTRLMTFTKTPWQRLLTLKSLMIELNQLFHSYGAIQVESLPLLPNIKYQGHSPVTPLEFSAWKARLSSSEKCPLQRKIFQGNFDPHHALFLDRQGTPFHMPARLAYSFAQTAPMDRASSRKAVCRRYAYQHVDCFQPQLPSEGAANHVDYHLHAFYDITILQDKLIRNQEDTLVIDHATFLAQRLLREHSLHHLIRYFSTLFATSLRPCTKSVLGIACNLLAFLTLDVFEAELLTVAWNALASLGPHEYCIYWTHALLIPALLHEVFGVAIQNLGHFVQALYMDHGRMPTKQALSHLFSKYREQHFDTQMKPADVLHKILTFRGYFEDLAHYIESLTPEASHQICLPVILEHVLDLHFLLGATQLGQHHFFCILLPPDRHLYETGIAFYAVPMSKAFSSPSDPPTDQLRVETIAFEQYMDRLIVGGRADRLVHGFHRPSHRSLQLAQQHVVYNFEIALDNMIALHASAVPSTKPTLPKQGRQTKKMPEKCAIHIMGCRVDLQCFAIRLKRHLQLKGLPCQRRMERFVDVAQLRRRAKIKKSTFWVIQIKGSTANTHVYRLQLYQSQNDKPCEDVQLDDYCRVVEYLADHASTGTSSTTSDLFPGREGLS